MFFKVILLSIFFLLPGNHLSEVKKIYHKEYYETGKLKVEGWLKNNEKSGYWKFYYTNGQLSEKGHYKNNKRTEYWYFYDSKGHLKKEGHYIHGIMDDWWLFYDAKGKINHKCQLSHGKKNGYCLKYRNEKLISAEKYKNGKKIKEWYSFASFRRENKLSDLK